MEPSSSSSSSSSSCVEEDQKKKMIELEEPLLINHSNNQKGGFRTLPFIIANEAFEKVASMGMTPNMIVYFVNDYHLDMAVGTNILNLYSSASNFTPLLGAFLADSFLGRFWAIGFGSILSFMGMILLWSTAMFPGARPPPCNDHSNTSSTPTTSQLTLLCSSFIVMAVGAGGIRGASMAFGTDQIDNREDSFDESTSLESSLVLSGKTNDKENDGVMASYLGWYYAASAISSLVAITCFAYFQEHFGWKIGFGIPVACMFVSALSFFLASSFYIKVKGKASLLIGLVQVIVASFKNRHLTLSSESDGTLFYYNKRSRLVAPTDKLRFLSKACVIEDPGKDLTFDGKASNPWRLCTVDQVEELKALLNIIPIWSTGIIFSINSNQSSFSTIQVKSMDRHITPTFEIPMGSFGMFTILSVVTWILLYQYAILPIASRIMGRQVHFTPKQRIGFGFFLSTLSMAYTAILETIRRDIAIKKGFSDDPKGVLNNISALWTLPHNVLGGFADGLVILSQIEFYISEFPKSMSGIASTIGGLASSLASLLASLIVSIVDKVSTRGGKVSWISSNINRGHYDYYYWVLASLSFVNFLYFLFVCWVWYPCEGQVKVVEDDGGEVACPNLELLQ